MIKKKVFLEVAAQLAISLQLGVYNVHTDSKKNHLHQSHKVQMQDIRQKKQYESLLKRKKYVCVNS